MARNTQYPLTITVNLSCCEHDGDLDNYERDFRRAGASVLDSGIDEDDECGWCRLRIAGPSIHAAVKATDAWLFVY
jgi:hypothetical protein